MKIIFFCGSAEPGKDGVGDYTRRLCGELIRIGHVAQIVSLCDKKVTTFTNQNQEVEEVNVTVYRIPNSSLKQQRLMWSQEIINTVQPDWISLQFVPYSFNPKGLPFWLPMFLKKLKGKYKWHVMFHELWLGMDSKATLKSKCIGILQKMLICKLLEEKRIINTQTDLYKYKIETLGCNAQILPLFSNIIKNSRSSIAKTMDDVELKFCIFGSIHYGAPAEQFIKEMKQVLFESKEKRILKFVFIGHCGFAIKEWSKVLVANKINFEITGFVSDNQICNILSSCQYGISTTPYLLNQKSGSLAAMFDHQLPVLCVARKWEVNGFNKEPFLNLTNYENKESINNFLNKKFILSNDNNIDFVALKFLEGLK